MNIPYGKQNITQDDIDAVIEALKSDFLTQGPCIPKFEMAVCEYVNAKFGVATNSATSALHIGVKALGLKKGELVWTSPITFVASANCALYCGADIDFVDIDQHTFNMCPRALEEKLKRARTIGRLPSIVIVVHMAGQSADMKAINKLSKEFGFKIIEDASHAIGATYGGQKVGCCEYSDLTVFSFHPVKIITTAEGGIVTTNDSEIAKRMTLLRSHGVTRDGSKLVDQTQGSWFYEMHELGFNYRLTDIQAALGLSQLRRIDDIIARRNNLASRYNDLLQNCDLQLPWVDHMSTSSFHLYIIRLNDVSKRKKVFEHLKEKGIGVNVHYIPVHIHPFYVDMGFKQGDFENAENYYERAITIPLFPELTYLEQDYIVSEVKFALRSCDKIVSKLSIIDG